MKEESIQQDRQADSQAGGREASSRVFLKTAENKWLDIVEGSAISETEKETAQRGKSPSNRALKMKYVCLWW